MDAPPFELSRAVVGHIVTLPVPFRHEVRPAVLRAHETLSAQLRQDQSDGSSASAEVAREQTLGGKASTRTVLARGYPAPNGVLDPSRHLAHPHSLRSTL